jgi:hypothetical protein
MDTGTIITTIIMLTACIVPFVMMNLKRKKKEKWLLESLQNLAGSHNAVISRFDIWGHAAIGIDETTYQAFFFKKTAAATISQHVKLADIVHCSIIKTGKNIDAKHLQPVFDVIALSLKQTDTQQPDIQFELYNAQHDGFAMKDELQMASKWCGLFSN